jgi:hypothetical protein
MKKSELKSIIKECVKEVIFEEGVLSGIITEVAQGLGSVVAGPRRQATITTPVKPEETQQLKETKQKVLSAIGGSAYDSIKEKMGNPSLYEGTNPLPSDSKGALAGVAPHDPGIDISSLPGSRSWAHVVNKIK